MSFSDLGLDSVLVQGLKRCGFVTPTVIQQQCIPAVLKGQDVLALSKTGTGKTLAYLLPLLQTLSLYDQKDLQPWMAVILVPTKELTLQVRTQLMELINSAAVLSITVTDSLKKGDRGRGSIVLCTPNQMVTQLCENSKKSNWMQNVQMLIIDEADLLLSYGYDADMRRISPKIPRSCQCILASATQSDDLNSIVKLVMENPKCIDLLSSATVAGMCGYLSHYYLICQTDEKALHLLVLLQFQSISQPAMIFVNTINNGYRLKLFLECFKINCGILHRALPQNTRQQRIDEFNKGKHEVFIVVDDLQTLFAKEEARQRPKERKQKKKKSKEAEFGVARGLDFKNVKTVVNFDLPQTTNGYIHRVGRSARAGNFGMALTLFTPNDQELEQAIRAYLNTSMEVKLEGSREEIFREFQRYSKQQVTALKYRASNVMQSVSRKAIDGERKRDLRHEILCSRDLDVYFANHPEEKRLLEINQTCTSPKRRFAEVSQFPTYLVPYESVRTAPKRQKRVPKIDPLTQKASRKRQGRLARG